jgi:S-adenosylmethionine:tRNA ribosyltransferase-isomerase
MRVSDFEFDLPPGLIAQRPPARREDSRMMILDRKTGGIAHADFRDLPGRIDRNDVIILNDTRVFPAKAWGRGEDGSRVEFLFVREIAPGVWECLTKPARKAKPGASFAFPSGFEARVTEALAEGARILTFNRPDILAGLKSFGYAPLPPYIKRPSESSAARVEDLDRYQTVFAARDGSIAAPTAGLHFTPGVLAGLEAQGARIHRVTLEVGRATFQPVRVGAVEDHVMGEETFDVPAGTAEAIGVAKHEGRPVVAVGTTVVRTLESAWEDGRIRVGRRGTTLFIYPGYRFNVVDRLLTNFHLPGSTLLMLVAAFAGRDLIMRAYHEAVRDGYRFFSYGDCMLIL